MKKIVISVAGPEAKETSQYIAETVRKITAGHDDVCVRVEDDKELQVVGFVNQNHYSQKGGEHIYGK